MLTQGLYFDRTLLWDAEFEGDVRNLTAADINAAVRRHLDLNKMTFVKAGDFANAGNPVLP
jgi:zinc protease